MHLMYEVWINFQNWECFTYFKMNLEAEVIILLIQVETFWEEVILGNIFDVF